MYIPAGAFWGAEDVEKMGQAGSLKGLKVTMKKHPSSLKVLGSVADKLEEVKDLDGEQILYRGPVRELCALAPNNVNTMACGVLFVSRDLFF